MKLTRNFWREEFSRSQVAARRNIDNTIPFSLTSNLHRLATTLQILRNRLCEHYGREVFITVTSGYRSKKLNKMIGGHPRSFHMLCLAADITASGLTPYELAMFIRDHMKDVDLDQVILEHDRWVHLGIAESGHKHRRQFLEAKWQHDIFGKNRVRYMHLIRRERQPLEV